jgi:DNA-binding MarR family transcriptional regulator
MMAGECLWLRARRLSRVMTRAYDEALRPLGIQISQLGLLNVVALCGEGGGGMSTIAEILVMDRTTLSRNLRPLERSGLIKVVRAPDDGRARLVVLTPAGRRVIEEATPLWERAHRETIASLGPQAAAELRERLDAAVVAAGGSPGPKVLSQEFRLGKG